MLSSNLGEALDALLSTVRSGNSVGGWSNTEYTTQLKYTNYDVVNVKGMALYEFMNMLKVNSRKMYVFFCRCVGDLVPDSGIDHLCVPHTNSNMRLEEVTYMPDVVVSEMTGT